MNAKIRSTGPNPTDTAITLIAHNDNADTLIGTHRRGEIAVGTQLLDDPRLLSTVLVDTPGSGDPTLVEELVRDFLPFCDTLVYVLSAAAPLDNSDLPTLKKASEDLGFIPIKLVCTRADEFRKDKSVILSEENFDSDAANQFLIDLSRRLKLSIPGLNVSPEEMLLLDNQSGHNVEILQNIIFENLGGGATSAQQLHTHKVNYYANAARAIRDFYIQHVEVKIEGLGTFLTIATENHNSFRNVETMANSNLTAWWAQSKLALETQAITENEWITNLDMCSDLPDEISNTNRLKTSLALIQNSFQTSAEETAQEICRRLKRYLLEEFEAHLSKLRRSIRNTGDKDSLPFAPHRLEEATGRGMFEIDVRLPYSTRMQVEDLPDVCDRMLRQYLRTLSTSVKQFKDRISADAATLTSRQTIGLSMNQLHEMFEEFVKSVRLYRSGVLANNARRTAQEAGIVDTLAELEKAEITPAQRDGWLRQITSRVFPNWELGLADFKSKTGGLHERLAAEDHSIAIIRKKPVNYADSEVMAPEPNLDWLGTDSKVVKHLDDAVSEYAGLNDTFFSQLNTEYEETIANEREKLEEDIRQIRAVQKQRRLKFLAAPIFIAVIATVIYHLWGQESPNTWLADIFGGVAVVVFFGLASKVWDKTNAKIEKREKRHFRSSAEIAQRLLKDRAKMFRWSFVDAKKDLIKAEVSSKLSQMMQRYFLEVVTTPNLERYEETRKTATRIQSIANEYVAASKTLIEVLSGYYTQTETNLAVLAEVSSAIRAEAIEPSFERLKQRDEKLRSLRNELALIEPMATSAPAQ